VGCLPGIPKQVENSYAEDETNPREVLLRFYVSLAIFTIFQDFPSLSYFKIAVSNEKALGQIWAELDGERTGRQKIKMPK
jgi:hypothetical protein